MKKLIYLVSFIVFMAVVATSCGQQTCPSYANYYRSVAGKKTYTTSTKSCPVQYKGKKNGKPDHKGKKHSYKKYQRKHR
jgi:hypothetical protein